MAVCGGGARGDHCPVLPVTGTSLSGPRCWTTDRQWTVSSVSGIRCGCCQLAGGRRWESSERICFLSVRLLPAESAARPTGSLAMHRPTAATGSVATEIYRIGKVSEKRSLLGLLAERRGRRGTRWLFAMKRSHLEFQNSAPDLVSCEPVCRLAAELGIDAEE